jgi:hypothetical protein
VTWQGAPFAASVPVDCVTPRQRFLAHLVAGVLPEDEAAPNNARPQLNLMTKLIARLAPKGLYALAVDRQGRTPEIHCVFEKDTDAAEAGRGRGGHRCRPLPRLGKPANVRAGRRHMPRHRRSAQDAPWPADARFSVANVREATAPFPVKLTHHRLRGWHALRQIIVHLRNKTDALFGGLVADEGSECPGFPGPHPPILRSPQPVAFVRHMQSTPQVPVGCRLFTFDGRFGAPSFSVHNVACEASTGIMSFLSIVSAMGVCRPPRSSRQGLTADPNATSSPSTTRLCRSSSRRRPTSSSGLEEPRTKHADVN